MEEKLNILDLNLDCVTVKNAMIQAIQFLDSDSIDTIEIISMNTLMEQREDEGWKKLAGELTMLLPGEAEILRAADISDRTKLKEAEEGTFLKMFIKYLEKKRKNVYILAESEEEFLKTRNLLRNRNRGIRFSGYSVLDPQEAREENVINEINGTETDCILSVLHTPYQEEFISRNKALLNVRVWLGCGAVFAQQYENKGPAGRLKHFLQKKLFWYRVEHQNKEEQGR